jgi:S-DNA-T family DNA segregation ATPase FtsK/SpoIIIE
VDHPLSNQRHAELIRNLFRSAAERAQREAEIVSTFQRQAREIEQEYQEGRARLAEAQAARRRQTEAEYHQALQNVAEQSEQELADAEGAYDEVCQKAQDLFEQEQQAAAKKLEEGKWEAAALYDAAKNSLEGQLTPRLNQVTEQAKRLSELQMDVNRLRQELKMPAAAAAGGDMAAGQGLDPFTLFEQQLYAAEGAAAELRDYRRRPLLKALLLSPMFLALWVVLMLLGRVVYQIEILKPEGLPWLGITVTATIALSVLILLLRSMYRKHQTRLMCEGLAAILREADVTRGRCLDVAEQERRVHLREAEQKRDESSIRREQRYHRRMEEVTRARDSVLREARERYQRQVTLVKQCREQVLREIEQKYQPLLAELRQHTDAASRQFEQRHQEQVAAHEQAERLAWIDLATSWHETIAQLRGDVLEINQAANALFPSWLKAGWEKWQSPRATPPAIRFGELDINLRDIPGGIPQDERLKQSTLTSFSLPALVPFANSPSLLYKAAGDGREAAIRSLQSVMLRLLTSLPAGKVRFTIIDPVGLGENFAGFMHLADFDESLVASRIWTEPDHIEQRLADMSEHLENVIQKYLRNEYQSIEEYNREAGEVAEPFRFLIVANFPANFSEKAVKRLISIAGSGPRCGVYTLITCDTKQKLPPGCRVADLEQHHTVLGWNGEKFVWQHEVFKDFALRVDAPPPAEIFTQIVHVVGEHSRDANRVELPFKNIVPPPEELWTGDCGSELVAPLGQAGATKLQHLRLGRGTSQHVLVAGKTGSGKSTLLHVLITSLALRYSPDEVQLYLVDFKKGVEFKTYATHALPHAPVVAVESEREFGLSVLQRLDGELKQRGDAFRNLGVQDLNAYRQAAGRLLPRILLIIDEFQELFVEDDRVAAEASLLLDRLVRQGRAFGIHVFLGSQTLGGAYSLARSTLGQMAVRIALECSESDANLILSEGNTAARLLSRPGEAIYNDANGRLEGNKPFQIAWLSDADRETYLRQVQEIAKQRRYTPPGPQVVFEGNAPADLGKNRLLAEMLEAPAWPAAAPQPAIAWLGDPVAIKEPTAASFRRQGSSNLLIVGQQESAAVGMFSSSLVALAAQHSPQAADGARAAKFCVLDGSRDGEQGAHFARLAETVPHAVDVATWRDAGRVLAAVATEVDRRSTANDFDAAAIYLFVYDLGRFRDLRREDDYGYGRRGEDAAASPAQNFQKIIRDGAALGVHVIVWCDTATALTRVFDRTTLREFEQRVVFQMSGDDSSNLIDSPAATKLGHYRALFHSEEAGQLEKFRPYDLPSAQWLAHCKQRLASRRAIPARPRSPGQK